MSLIWEKLLRPALFRLDAERAHEMAVEALRLGLAPAFAPHIEIPAVLGPVERFGLQFPNPIGVAAGFDKNALVVRQLGQLGFGFVETGTVTYEPQPGNPKPRLFRLPEDGALINRLGFNNQGAAAIAARLAATPRSCVVGVNIGRNREVPNDKAIENYLKCFELVHPVADYIAVNVSSPNTPGLRDLQQASMLEELVQSLQARNRELGPPSVPKPLLVKISPDLADADIETAADVCMRHGVAGIIATNTTVSRDNLKTPGAASMGPGGLSGRPLLGRANDVVKLLYQCTGGQITIVGVGGIFTAEDAFERIAAGASLLEVYTGFVYGGQSFPSEIIRGLAEIITARGFESVDEVVGSDSSFDNNRE